MRGRGTDCEGGEGAKGLLRRKGEARPPRSSHEGEGDVALQRLGGFVDNQDVHNGSSPEERPPPHSPVW